MEKLFEIYTHISLSEYIVFLTTKSTISIVTYSSRTDGWCHGHFRYDQNAYVILHQRHQTQHWVKYDAMFHNTQYNTAINKMEQRLNYFELTHDAPQRASPWWVLIVIWKDLPIVYNLSKHWGGDKMIAILQTTFSNALSWIQIYEIWIRFHWIMSPSV